MTEGSLGTKIVDGQELFTLDEHRYTRRLLSSRLKDENGIKSISPEQPCISNFSAQSATTEHDEAAQAAGVGIRCGKVLVLTISMASSI